jgi:chaperonin GroEL (HSP60 family)
MIGGMIEEEIRLNGNGIIFNKSKTLISNLNSILELQEIISTSFGPNSSDKLFQDEVADVFMSNDGLFLKNSLKI